MVELDPRASAYDDALVNVYEAVVLGSSELSANRLAIVISQRVARIPNGRRMRQRFAAKFIDEVGF